MAEVISFFRFIKLDIVILVVVKEEREKQDSIYVDQDELEHGRHQKLAAVLRH